jgi:hypothetical protein
VWNVQYDTYLSIGDVDVDRSSSVKCREDMGRSMVEWVLHTSIETLSLASLCSTLMYDIIMSVSSVELQEKRHFVLF